MGSSEVRDRRHRVGCLQLAGASITKRIINRPLMPVNMGVLILFLLNHGL